jgi:hypothetical protein
MRAQEILDEIKYSSNIADSKQIISAMNSRIDKKLGIVDHHSVYMLDGGNCFVYYLIDSINTIQCYLVTEKNEQNSYTVLRQVENVSGKKGTLLGLLHLLVSKNIKFVIKSDEPITRKGLKWITNLINSSQGLNMHDVNGNKLNTEELNKEWLHSLENPDYDGHTSIFIESKIINLPHNQYWFEDQTNITGLLKNQHRFIE